MSAVLPRYPVYLPSKGRAQSPLTVRVLHRDGAPFYLVIEPQERDDYLKVPGVREDRVLVLPFRDRGLYAARCWIKDHATYAGAARHWQLDDNLRGYWRRWRTRNIRCEAGVALRVVEDFADRYENIALAGHNYYMFAPNKLRMPPFCRNVHVYSSTLVLNTVPHRWKHLYNDDTDLCLQVLSDGWCTVLFNAFLVWKMQTMTMRGGNTDQLYRGDGRLRMARSLERAWPGVVKVSRRFQQPQHVVNWRKFDTPLRRRPGVEIPSEDFEYGMRLVPVGSGSDEHLRLVESFAGGDRG